MGLGIYGELGSPTLFNDFWQYDPVQDSWTQLTNFPGSPREGAFVFVINDTIYFGAGWDGTGTVADVWGYNITNGNWSQKQNFPGVARAEAIGFTLNEKGYVGLGYNAFGPGFSSAVNRQKDFYEYDPVRNSWTAIANYPSGGRSSPAAFVIADSAYVLLGEDSIGYTSTPVTGFTKTVYKYGPQIASDIKDINRTSLNINLSPLPNNGKFTVHFDKPIFGPVDFSVTDMTGKTVWTRSLSNFNTGNLAIDLGPVGSGIYILAIRTAGTLINKKIVIE